MREDVKRFRTFMEMSFADHYQGDGYSNYEFSGKGGVIINIDINTSNKYLLQNGAVELWVDSLTHLKQVESYFKDITAPTKEEVILFELETGVD